MICSSCRKTEVENYTWWQRTRSRLFVKLFPTDYVDLSQEKYTQGFSDGYKTGFQHCQNYKIKVEDYDEKGA